MFESEERREFALENGLGALDYFEAERADHSKHKDETRKERVRNIPSRNYYHPHRLSISNCSLF